MATARELTPNRVPASAHRRATDPGAGRGAAGARAGSSPGGPADGGRPGTARRPVARSLLLSSAEAAAPSSSSGSGAALSSAGAASRGKQRGRVGLTVALPPEPPAAAGSPLRSPGEPATPSWDPSQQPGSYGKACSGCNALLSPDEKGAAAEEADSVLLASPVKGGRRGSGRAACLGGKGWLSSV